MAPLAPTDKISLASLILAVCITAANSTVKTWRGLFMLPLYIWFLIQPLPSYLYQWYIAPRFLQYLFLTCVFFGLWFRVWGFRGLRGFLGQVWQLCDIHGCVFILWIAVKKHTSFLELLYMTKITINPHLSQSKSCLKLPVQVQISFRDKCE